MWNTPPPSEVAVSLDTRTYLHLQNKISGFLLTKCIMDLTVLSYQAALPKAERGLMTNVLEILTS